MLAISADIEGFDIIYYRERNRRGERVPRRHRMGCMQWRLL